MRYMNNGWIGMGGRCGVAAVVWAYLTVFAVPAPGQEKKSPEELAFEQAEADRKKLQEEEQAESRKEQLGRALTLATEVQTKFTELESIATNTHTRLENLLTSDEGKCLATNKLFVVAFLARYDNRPASIETIKTEKRLADDRQARLKAEADRTPPGLPPTVDVIKAMDDSYAWAVSRLQTYGELKSAIDGMLLPCLTSPLPDTTGLSTLRIEIDRFRATQAQEDARAHAEGIVDAQGKRREIIKKSTYEQTLESAHFEAQLELLKTRSAMAQMNAEQEIRQRRQNEEREIALTSARIREADTLAELDRFRKLAEARRRQEDTHAEIQIRQTDDATAKAQRIANAQRPEVCDLLKPFVSGGYWQPGIGVGKDKTPMSLAALQATGALEDTVKGLDKLMDIGKDGRNDRPHWGYPIWRKCSEQQREEIKKAQAYLRDFGVELVELKKLSK